MFNGKFWPFSGFFLLFDVRIPTALNNHRRELWEGGRKVETVTSL